MSLTAVPKPSLTLQPLLSDMWLQADKAWGNY